MGGGGENTQLTHSLHQLAVVGGEVRGSTLMLTNKQDKRDGPTTEEHEPHPGTASPCMLQLLFSTSLLSHSSHLPSQCAFAPFNFWPVPHLTSLLSVLDKRSLRCEKRKKRRVGGRSRDKAAS